MQLDEEIPELAPRHRKLRNTSPPAADWEEKQMEVP
jgi:hypothetical protein